MVKIRAGEEIRITVPDGAQNLVAKVDWCASNVFSLGSLGEGARLEVKNPIGRNMWLPFYPIYAITANWASSLLIHEERLARCAKATSCDAFVGYGAGFLVFCALRAETLFDRLNSASLHCSPAGALQRAHVWWGDRRAGLGRKPTERDGNCAAVWAAVTGCRRVGGSKVKRISGGGSGFATGVI